MVIARTLTLIITCTLTLTLSVRENVVRGSVGAEVSARKCRHGNIARGNVVSRKK
jgi:hypothetical protein